MNTKMTATLAVAIVAVMVFAAVGSTTYSWWSDSEEAEIDISSGYLDVEVDNILFTDGIGGETKSYNSFNDVKIKIVADNTNTHVSVLQYDVTFKSSIDAQYKISVGANVTDYTDISGTTVNSVQRTGVSVSTIVTDYQGNNPFIWTKLAKPVAGVADSKITYTVVSTLTFTDVQMFTKGTLNVKNQITQFGAVDETIVDMGNSTVDDIEVLGTNGNMWDVDIAFTGVDEITTLSTEVYSVTSTADNSFIIDLTLDNDVEFDSATVSITIPGVINDGMVVYLGNGSQPTAVTITNDGVNTTVTFTTTHFSEFMIFDMIINSVDEFKLFADMVNKYGYTFSGKTVTLANNIDLSGVDWTPIGSSYKFMGTFDGNGKKISNLSVETTNDAGLFGVLNGIVKNLVIDSPVVSGTNCVGAVAGEIFKTGTIQNVTVYKPEVFGNHYVGGIVGFSYGSIIDCIVEDAKLVATPNVVDGSNDNGDKVGGIVGYIANGDVSGCELKGGDLTAYRDIGGIVGCSNKDNYIPDIINNTVSGDVTLTVDQKTGYYGDETPNAGVIVGREINANISDNKIGSANIIYNLTNEFIGNKIYGIDGLKAFRDSVNAGNSYAKKTISLVVDIDLNNEEWTPIGTNSTKFMGVFDGSNHTISNLKISGSKSDVGLFGFTTDGEIKNLTVKNANVKGYLNVGVVAGTPYTSKYTSITVKGHVEVNGFSYVGGVGGKNAYADWTDITVDVDEFSYVNANSVNDEGIAYRTYVGGVIGFMGEGGHTVKNVTSNIDVIGSTIDVGGIVGIAHYGNSFINCISSGDVTIIDADDAGTAEQIGGIAGVWNNNTGYTVTFTDCSYTGTLKVNVTGVDLSDNTIVGSSYNNSGKGVLIINGTIVSAPSISKENVSTSIASGGSFILGEDVTINQSINKDLALGLNGKVLEATGTINLTNNSNLSISNGDYIVNGTYGHIDVRPNSVNGSTVMFDGVDFSYNKLEKTYGPSTNRLGSVLEFCATETDGNAKIVFKNCTFSNAQILFEGMSGKVGKFDATFENCTFNCLTSSAPIYVQNYVEGKISIKDCKFNIIATSGTASAISVSPSSSTSVTIVAENNTINATAAIPYTFDASKGEDERYNIKVNGTPANIKFISSYDNCDVTESGTVKTGIAA